MKISVITVCYNSAATVEETIRSVLAQSHPDVEYIIIDGNSSDDTVNIIEQYRDRIAVFVSEPDKGIYDAMNKGLARATGEVVGILNSDDLYAHDQVLANVAVNFSDPGLQGLCTDVSIFSGSPDHIIRRYRCTRWKPWMFRIGHQPPHPGFFVRKHCYDRFGHFDTGFRTAADFDLLLRFILKHRISMKYLPETTVLMRSGGASQQGIKALAAANREDHLSLRKNGYFSWLPLIWMKYLIKVFQFF